MGTPSSRSGTEAAILVLLVVLLVFMPYSTLVLQGLRHVLSGGGVELSSHVVQAMTGWKEILLAIGFLLVLVKSLSEGRLPFAITRLDLYLLGFLLLGTLVGGIVAGKAVDVVFGFRYDFSPFLYYFLARSVPLSRDEWLRIARWLVLLSIPILVFSVLQVAVLPAAFLTILGYSNDVSVTGNPLPPVHFVSNSLTIVRAMATFPGPNSLAMYLVQIILLAVFCVKGWLGRWFAPLLIGGAGICLLLTFSRGHLVSLVGALVILTLYVWLHNRYVHFSEGKGWLVPWGLLLATLGLTTVLILGSSSLPLATGSGSVREILFHQESTAEHADLRQEAITIIGQHPEGTGLGTSGLATTNTGGAVFNPESWYIQITQELGWVGLLLTVLLLGWLCAALVRIHGAMHDPADRGIASYLLAGFLAVAISANFLPAWFEVGSLTWWILFGLFVSDYLSSFPGEKRVFPIQKSA
ncbi:MAG: O-antigen ligase family protein [bacterium]